MNRDRISIVFAGDFCSTKPSGITMSENLKSLLLSTDFNVVNFEGPLASDRFAAPNKTVLRQSDESPKWCEENGFNIISLANNHLLDFGIDGMRRTVGAFRKSKVIGVGKWREAYKVHFFENEGKRIGLFAASSADLASLQDVKRESSEGSAWINHPSVNGIIKEAKKECDYLLVFVHAGVEYMKVPLPEWRLRFKELVDIGADAVICSHPHVVQGWEEYKGCPIVYSLGNFFFDYFKQKGKPDGWDNGLIVKLELSNLKHAVSFECFPTIKYGQLIQLDNTKQTKEYVDSLCDIIRKEDEYEDIVNKEVQSLYPKYKGWLLYGLGAIDNTEKSFKSRIKIMLKQLCPSNGNAMVALHQIREESTRYILTRGLMLQNTETEIK